MHRRAVQKGLSLCRLCESSLAQRLVGALSHQPNPGRGPHFSTLAVADEKLEPAGHVKVETATKHAAQETVSLMYDLPSEWYSKKMSPILKRDRMVLRLVEWVRLQSITPALLVKLIQSPLSPAELRKYTSNQIARIVHAIGQLKKSQRLIGDEALINIFLRSLIDEATSRKRLMTYDGMGLAQVAYGFSLMDLRETTCFKLFAEEAVKPYRIRNTSGRSMINLLEAFRNGNYRNAEHIQILSQAAMKHRITLPAFSLPKLLQAWGHFRYEDESHVRAVLAEILKETRLNILLPSHIEEILTACAKLQFREHKVITLFAREMIYSRKWKFMQQSALTRIVWALGELRYEYPSHWRQILAAVLDPDRLTKIEPNMITDVYAGWSKVAFRDSTLLEQLGTEAVREAHMTEYSTKQLFEIFKSQQILGQFEKEYVQPILDRLQDTDKLMRCNLETKMKIFLYPNAKKLLGMKNVASLAKEIFQPQCLQRLDRSVLLTLAEGLAVLGPRFGICFDEVLIQLRRPEYLADMSVGEMCQLLSVWEKLDFETTALRRFAAQCCRPELLGIASEEELLRLSWTLSHLGGPQLPAELRLLFSEVMKRPMSVFTDKGLKMLLQSVSKAELLDRHEFEPLVRASVEEKRLAAASASHLEDLITVLANLGCEAEAEKLRKRDS